MIRLRMWGIAAVLGLAAAPVWADFAAGQAAAAKGDHKTAAREWQESAEKGDVNSQMALGFLYQKGLGVELDYSKAVAWWERASKQGIIEAMRLVARAYLQSGPGVKQNVEKGLTWYRKAAEGNDMQAQLDLAQIQLKFANDDTDLKSAFYWLNRAAANGSVVAMKNLAMMHEKGIGTPANAEESKKWRAKYEAAHQAELAAAEKK